MKKKMIRMLALTAIFSLVSFNAVFAYTFDEIWTVKNKNETAKTDTFTLTDPAPWLYVKLPTPPTTLFWKSSVSSDWLFGDSLQGESDSGLVSGKRSFWLQLSNWDSVKQLGTWTADANFTYYASNGTTILKNGSGSTAFNVTAAPEPISSALFLIGGTALAAWQIRRKKKHTA